MNHGDDINDPPIDGYERFGLQNANGITRGNMEAFDVMEAMEDLHLGIFGITKPNVAMTPEQKNLINTRARQRFGRATATCTSTPHKNRDYLPGGILQLIRGTAAGRLHSTGTNKMGRYSWSTLQGSNEKLLCVITAYRVCQKRGTRVNTNPKRIETRTAYMQQIQYMLEHKVHNPDPRSQILEDLTEFILKKREAGCEIVLMMDANESMTPGKDITKFMEKTHWQTYTNT